MGTKQLSNQKAQNRIHTADGVFPNSIPRKGLCKNKGSNPPSPRRETLITCYQSKTCSSQNPFFSLSHPATFSTILSLSCCLDGRQNDPPGSLPKTRYIITPISYILWSIFLNRRLFSVENTFVLGLAQSIVNFV
jgi:hypothetical protein